MASSTPGPGLKVAARATATNDNQSESVMRTSRMRGAVADESRPLAQPFMVGAYRRQSGVFDPKHEFPDALARVRRPAGMVEWGYISIRPYTRR